METTAQNTKASEILRESDLREFTGTENWYRTLLFGDYLYTDGVKYVAEEGGAYAELESGLWAVTRKEQVLYMSPVDEPPGVIKGKKCVME